MTFHQSLLLDGQFGRRRRMAGWLRITLVLLMLSSVAGTFGTKVTNASAGDDLPAWLRAASNATLPQLSSDVPAVVLADESVVTIEDDGRMTRSDFYAVKVLTREGREVAVARAVYNTDSEKVKELRACS
jgi:hypothetical protein